MFMRVKHIGDNIEPLSGCKRILEVTSYEVRKVEIGTASHRLFECEHLPAHKNGPISRANQTGRKGVRVA